MAAAEKKRPGLGSYGLHEDLQLATADETVVIGRVLAQVEGQAPRLSGCHGLARGGPDFGLDTTAPDGPGYRPVLPHQELGRLVAWNRATHLDDGGQGAFLAQAAQSDQLLVEVHSGDYTTAKLIKLSTIGSLRIS